MIKMGTGKEARALLDKTYRVIKPWKIGNCKMKEKDKLTVFNYHPSSIDQVIEFHNSRLPHYTFHTAMWLFKRNTEEMQ